ncbi:MAG: NAD-dependent protein deacylase [Candidatus Bipolaricaulia bacterium]
MKLKRAHQQVAELLLDAETVVAFTGAGISTESSIPDFRSPGGIWDRFDPDDFTIERFYQDPKKYWEKRLELHRAFRFEEAQPNPAHHAVADLERMGKLNMVITQNIDGLHQAAGNSEARVIELHGNVREVKCMVCEARYPRESVWEEVERGDLPPRCERCGGVMKLATVSFGELLPADALRRAEQAARTCDLFMVVGSSLGVEPAASLPRNAKWHGAKLMIINLEPTPLDRVADIVIHEKAGACLTEILSRLT